MKKSSNYTEGVLCAGFGGQGIIFMGKLIAEAALIAKRYVTWMPSYGAEVRGGTAYSMVNISNKEISSPIVTKPTVLIVMNEPSLLKYEDKISPGGALILNRSMTDEQPKRKDIKIIKIPLTDMAARLGNTRCANMIAVGAFAKISKMITLRNAIEALKDLMKGREDLLLLNKGALEKGHKL